MTSPPDDNTADTQAIIAALRSERDAALAREAALAEVLEVINRSPDDPQPVFEAILEKARFLCGAEMGALQDWDGEYIRVLARYGYSEDVKAHLTPLRQRSRPGLGQQPVLLGARFAHVLDATKVEIRADEDEGVRNFIERSGTRTWLAVPLRRTNALVGFISVARSVVRAFTDTEIVMLEGLAAQAVIAMENARLLSEQREALEQQTATAEVLQVINTSLGELGPVFEAMLDRAMRLCEAAFGEFGIFDGERFKPAALLGVPTAYAAVRAGTPRTDAPGTVGRHFREGASIAHIADLMAEEIYQSGNPDRRSLVDLGGARTMLAVALRKDEALLGDIMIYRQEVRPFSDGQIALLQNFAAQAVIAIENARLITAQREALEQQTATAEVLQVINASPGNLQPVFDTMLEKAMRLCGGAYGVLRSFDGERMHVLASRGVPSEYAGFLAQNTDPTAPGTVPMPGTALVRALQTGQPTQALDARESVGYTSGSPGGRAIADLGGARTILHVPLVKDEVAVGLFTIYRQEVRDFSDKQTALLENFAAQAVIAMENARLITETREALEQQTATAEVLQVINGSPGNLTPVFETILEKAHDLCDIAYGDLQLYDGEHLHSVAQRGLSAGFADRLRQGYRASDSPASRPLLAGSRFTHITDVAAVDSMVFRSAVRLDGIRTVLFVPLRKDGSLLGMITSARREVRPFTEKEISLLENFAAQAVIAMENARLITETREALEQQTATAEVLQVINASPGNLAPVFDTVLEKAMRLCGAAFGSLFAFDGKGFQSVAQRGVPTPYAEFRKNNPPKLWPGSPIAQLIATKRTIHVLDFTTEDIYRFGDADARSLTDLGDARTILFVPLLKDDAVLGFISIFRQEVRAFSDKQIALLENFAAQAVIAMESARLLHELRARTDELAQRQAELRITFENMGDGVAMFDDTQHLVAWNRKFQDILDVPDDIIARRQTFSEYVHYLAERGEYAPEVDPEEHVRGLIEQAGQSRTYERTRPDGRVIEIRNNPVPGGGFVVIYADITERKRNEAEIRAARDAAEEASRTIEAAYRDLKTAQANLIQAEKMASLGQLTAGIAHEIKNPLNFVNNFAALSVDLLGELKETAAPGFAALTDDQRAEIDDVSAMLTSNLEKITEHGKRADGIVKAMLEHSRGSSGERRMVDLNALIDEALNLAYHGARAQDQSFNITLEQDFGAGMAPIEVNPQDMTRVFLNIFANGFYAATKRARGGGDAEFAPTLKVTTRNTGETVEIRVRDNGTGIPADIRDKLFQPFFTTKPTGEGTGLGLSITYDIVTKAHGGSIAVDSKVGDYSEFTIRLPRNL